MISTFHRKEPQNKKLKNICQFFCFSMCYLHSEGLLLRRKRKKYDSWVHLKKKHGITGKLIESQIAQTASFVYSAMMMASQFNWNNLFTSYLRTLKLFTQKETDGTDQKISGVFTLSRVRQSQRNRGLWSLFKKQKKQGAISRTKAMNNGACQFSLVI